MAHVSLKRLMPYAVLTLSAAATGLLVWRWRAEPPTNSTPVLQPTLVRAPAQRAPALAGPVSALAAQVAPDAPGWRPPPVPEPRYHPRPESEWQGMLVDLSVAPTCESTEYCARAQVCREGRCAPCQRDQECLVGESCVLDHCLPNEQVECRSAAECQSAPCVLSGYDDAAPPRHNKAMSAYCGRLDSGRPQVDETPPTEPDTRPPRLAEELQRRLEQDLAEVP